MGVVLYVMVQSRLPFSDRDSKKLQQAQLSRDYKFVKPSLSKACKDLINLHLNPNASTRVNMDEVLAHKWFGSRAQASAESLSEEEEA